MGITQVTIQIANLTDGARPQTVECVVDTGAFLSVVPRETLKKLGVVPKQKKQFTLANGRKITRWIGEVRFCYHTHSGPSWAIFGEKGDKALLGVHAIEAMGLEVDPVNKRLKPTELLLL